MFGDNVAARDESPSPRGVLNGAQRKAEQNVFLIISRFSNRFSYPRAFILPPRTVSIYCIRNYTSASNATEFLFFFLAGDPLFH